MDGSKPHFAIEQTNDLSHQLSSRDFAWDIKGHPYTISRVQRLPGVN